MASDKQDPAPGQSVVLKELPQGLLDSLPIEDQNAISEVVGKPVRLNDYDSDGRAELEFVDRQRVLHFIYVDPVHIRSLTTDQ
jgi:hypothetical protein